MFTQKTGSKCKFGTNNNNWQAESGVKEGGIFFFGMTNTVIENRVAGHEHGMWTPGSAIGHGKGSSVGKICPQYAPFLKIKGNVFHDCFRFGMYPDNQYPRQLVRDQDGFDAVFSKSPGFCRTYGLLNYFVRTTSFVSF